MNEIMDDGLMDLATAIIVQCEKDYIHAKRIDNTHGKVKIENFLNSKEGSIFTFGNNQAILEKIKKKAETITEKRDERKNAWSQEDAELLKEALKVAENYEYLEEKFPEKTIGALRAKVKSSYGTESFKKLRKIVERG